MDKEKKPPRHSGPPTESQPGRNAEMDELLRRLSPAMGHSSMGQAKSGPDAIAAALEAAQRLASETDAEDAASDLAHDLTARDLQSAAGFCPACGYHNRGDNKFCGMCGAAVEGDRTESANAGGVAPREASPPSRAMALPPDRFRDSDPEARPTNRGGFPETHHYHHHYHHHYFPGGEAMASGGSGMVLRSGDSMRETERQRPTAGQRGDMSRAEAAVRRITQEWVLACNTKHLDDLLDLYVADALVLRSNYPPVRGAAAVREFFFGALDAGLGEVEVEPLRVEVVGDLAYEAGRCKALVPSATGKRREERGKYLWVCARQSNGEWKLAADCWSSDLTFTTMESDVPAGPGVKSSQPRKTP